MANAFGIELDTVKAYLGYSTGSPTDTSRDALLEIYLNSAISLLQRLTGRSLERALYRDTFDFHPQHTYLREAPVASVVSVSRGSTVYTDLTDYQVFAETGRLQFKGYTFQRSPRWNCYSGMGSDYLVVDYVGGYATLPANMLMALLAGVQAAEVYGKQFNTAGGIVKQLTVVDVGTTIYATKTNATTAAMQESMAQHLTDFVSDGGGLGDYLLHETERIGDAPGSPA